MGLFSSAVSDKPGFKKLKEEGCVVTFSVTIPAALVEAEIHNQVLRLQQKARLPGFRPGKAPLELISKQFSGHAREEALEHLMRHHVPEAMRSLSIRPVAMPTVSDVSCQPGKPLEFKAQAEVAPVFTAKDYLKIAVKRRRYPATEAELDKRLADLRESNARLEKFSGEVLAKGHYAVIDYQAARDGKPLAGGKGEGELVDTSSEQTVEGLVEGLIGMARGQSKELPVKIDGQPALLALTLREIKEKILPALDADFAKDMGFETLEELKSKLSDVIAKEGEAKTEREVEGQIQEALLKSNKIPLPPSLVEAQLENSIERLRQRLLGGDRQFDEKQLEDLRSKLRPQAEGELRVSYILSAIAEKEKVSALDADLEGELQKSLGETRTDRQREDIRKIFSERREAIAGMIRDRKTMAFLKEKAAVTDDPGA